MPLSAEVEHAALSSRQPLWVRPETQLVALSAAHACIPGLGSSPGGYWGQHRSWLQRL